MKVYIRQNSEGEFISVSCGVAYYAFKLLGWEINRFQSVDEIVALQPTSLVVGSISDVLDALRSLGIQPPTFIDYPEELYPFLGRKVWRSRMDALTDSNEWGIFIKPAERCKKFTGRAIRYSQDLIKCGDLSDGAEEVWCSELVEFVAEWRCFVRYDRILGVHQYTGDWRLGFDPQVVESAVAAYKSSPAGYVIDFGLTDTGETLVVEVNDGYALGSYGLPPIYYAQLLSARWAELTDTDDCCVSLVEAFA
jgi:hypothetical protein